MPFNKRRSDPNNLDPPQAMVTAAKAFLRYYVDLKLAAQHDPNLNDEVIDEQVDIANGAWTDWTGEAFNKALLELGLVEDIT